MISVIIPVYNEAKYLEELLPYLQQKGKEYLLEIIVADAESNDKTREVCKKYQVARIECSEKNRAAQMNAGAKSAQGDILYFVHADTLPPQGFARQISQILGQGIQIARYCTKFKSRNWLLKANAFFTRFDIFMCYGGDNTLAICKKLFLEINGFNESLSIMEDYDITERAKDKGRYAVLKEKVLVSARKYEKNSWLTVQKANFKAVKMYKKGVETAVIAEIYKKSLKY